MPYAGHISWLITTLVIYIYIQVSDAIRSPTQMADNLIIDISGWNGSFGDLEVHNQAVLPQMFGAAKVSEATWVDLLVPSGYIRYLDPSNKKTCAATGVGF